MKLVRVTLCAELFPHEAFGEGDEFRVAGVRLPANATIVEYLKNDSAQGAAKGLDAIASFPVRSFAEAVHDLDHAVAIEHAGNVVRNRGADLAAAGSWKFSEDQGGHLAADISEGVAVEEEKRRPAMALPEEFDGLL